MNYQPLSLKDSQAAAQRAGSILKYAGIFEHTKKQNKKKKKSFFSFIEKRFATFQPEDVEMTTGIAGS